MLAIFIRLLLSRYRYTQNSKIVQYVFHFILPLKESGWRGNLRQPLSGNVQNEGINVLELPKWQLFPSLKILNTSVVIYFMIHIPSSFFSGFRLIIAWTRATWQSQPIQMKKSKQTIVYIMNIMSAFKFI